MVNVSRKNQTPRAIVKFVETDTTYSGIKELHTILERAGTFDFEVFRSSLFPAVGAGSPTEKTSGYRAVWVRDNVHIAYAHFVAGRREAAVKNVLATASFFAKQHLRFTNIIQKKVDANDPMNRPHIRFNGETGEEISEKWPHAQNDALGAFLWFFCSLIEKREIAVTERHQTLLQDFVLYFRAIEYWQDQDSGHWEEQRKISASSIGAVLAGLRQLRALPPSSAEIDREELDGLIERGASSLQSILPSECIQKFPEKCRRYDAALLFLIDPFQVVDENTADRIVLDVVQNLQREQGIVRYPKDSYWGPDYRNLPAEKRTVDLSEDILKRSDYARAGKEARWCIFDSVLSTIFGRKYLQSRDPKHLSQQEEYFHRALLQLTLSPSGDGRLLLPEAYFLEDEQIVPNDHIPLQWAHANLLRAVCAMADSYEKIPN